VGPAVGGVLFARFFLRVVEGCKMWFLLGVFEKLGG
jgi:hypothetical protein